MYQPLKEVRSEIDQDEELFDERLFKQGGSQVYTSPLMYVKCVCVCVYVCEYMYVYVCEMCVYIYECWSLEALKLPYSPDANWKESPRGLSPKEFNCKAVSRPYFAAFSPLRYCFNTKWSKNSFPGY